MENWNDHIEINPEILYGKPVIKGTRIPVDLLLEKMSFGQSIESLKEQYPDLTNDDLYACMAYASSLIKNETTILLAS